jgi:hypothetical protein
LFALVLPRQEIISEEWRGREEERRGEARIYRVQSKFCLFKTNGITIGINSVCFETSGICFKGESIYKYLAPKT